MSTGPDAPEFIDSRTNAPEVNHEARPCHLCRTQEDRGAGVRPDQTRAWIPAISFAWLGEGQGGMVARLHDAQFTEVVENVTNRCWRPLRTETLGVRLIKIEKIGSRTL